MCTKHDFIFDHFFERWSVLKIVFRFKNTDHAAVELGQIIADVLEVHLVAAFDHGTKYVADFCDDSFLRCYNNDYYFAFTDGGKSSAESTDY